MPYPTYRRARQVRLMAAGLLVLGVAAAILAGFAHRDQPSSAPKLTTPPSTVAPIPVPPVTAEQLRRLPETTTDTTIAAAPTDDRPDATTTSGVVAHNGRASPVFTAPGGNPFARLPVRQLGNDTWLPVIAEQLASSLAVFASAAVAAGGAHVRAPSYHDAAYGISATGAAPLSATPTVFSTDGRIRSETAEARTSDGSVSVGSATVRAGAGKASATVNDFTAFDGLVTVSKVTATCDNAAVTSSADGPAAGALGENGSIAYGVKTRNDDGSTTIIGMRVQVTASAATPTALINVAAATCAANDPVPSGPATTTPAESTTPRPSPTSAKPTTAAPTRTSTAPTPTDTPTVPLDPNQPIPTSTSSVVPADPNEPRTTMRPAPTPKPRTTHLPVTG